ncbi:MAG: methyltransferase domain-containing protein [Candidatus Aenigmarchaeota archaeon]|nr:methyltransferase domain-containing protein [Candidatus Aenigmarchaeota archaeon]
MKKTKKRVKVVKMDVKKSAARGKRRSFDLIGDVAVVEADSRAQAQALARHIIATCPQVKCMLREESAVKGKFRLQAYQLVWQDRAKIRQSGLGPTETVHREHGCSYLLDVRKAFFNPREATIRQALASLVLPGERVLVLFCGVGPYAILCAKRGAVVAGVDANPAAIRYAEANARKNKVHDRVQFVCADVRAFHRGETYDRVIMPLGTAAVEYIQEAFRLCEKGGTIHCFGVGPEASPFKEMEARIAREARRAGVRVRFTGRRIVLPYAPRAVKVCVDVQVL